MLSFEAQQILGGKAILEKLVGLPFQTVQHRVSTLDAHPASSTDASIIVLVTGQLIVSQPPPLQSEAGKEGDHHRAWLTSGACFADWRRGQPALVLADVPAHPRGWILLCVRHLARACGRGCP